MNGNQFKQLFEEHFPTSTAYDWDNVGLQIGTLNKQLTGILVSLDLTLDVIDEAISKECNLILVHHPLIFRPLKTIHTDSYLGKMIERLIQHDITLYVAHTNFDVAPVGMNHYLSSMLELTDLQPLDELSETESLGIIGSLQKALTLDELVAYVKSVFKLDVVRVIGGKDQRYQQIAITGGSGSSVINKAIAKNADAYVTGDITYHYALDAKNMGLTIIDVGHNIEKNALSGLADFITNQGVTCPVVVSTVDTNPYKTL